MPQESTQGGPHALRVPPDPAPGSARRAGLALAAGFLILYFATMHGFLSLDGETMFLQTQSLVERGSLAAENEILRGMNAAPGRDGRMHPIYDLGQPVLGIPFYLAGKAAAAIAPAGIHPAFVKRFFVNLAGPAMGALACLFLFHLLVRLRIPLGAASIATVLFGAGTLIWPYTATYFREPTFAALFTGAVLFAIDPAPRRYGRTAIAGALLAYAIFTKQANAAVVPAFCLYFWLVERWRAWPRILVIGGLAGCALAADAAVSLAKFGSLAFAGFETERFHGDVIGGLYGLLASPGKGFLWFSPVLILALAGLGSFRRREPSAFVLVIGIAATLIGLYAAWSHWYGGRCWGPRFLVPLCPLLAVPLAFWLRERSERTEGIRRGAVIALMGFSAAIQLVPALGVENVLREKGTTELEACLRLREQPIVGYALSIPAGEWARPPDTAPLGETRSAALERIHRTTPPIWWLRLYRAGFPAAAIAAYLAASAASLAFLFAYAGCRIGLRADPVPHRVSSIERDFSYCRSPL